MANIEVQSNFDDAVKFAENLSGEVPKGVNEAGRKLSEEFMKASKRNIKQSPRNEVTGTGLNSFQVKQTGKGQFKVLAASYLNVLDKGRSPGSRPDQTNPRFEAAARQYGIPASILADVIEEKGTEAYPWIQSSYKTMERNAPKRVKIELRKALEESQTTL